ncbi:MAG: 1,4-alpha-glucan-branching enzyme, partial [Clostridia bacterium]|nr:1,4-alpha-glucan-branching enzyme [Clostridia bacterium]
MSYRIFEHDPSLLPFERDIDQRMKNYEWKKKELVGEEGSLSDFANGHEYFGFHKTKDGWFYREWAPAASEVFLTGDMVEWKWFEYKLTPLGNGVFEIFLKGKNALWNGCHVKTIIRHGDRVMERIPLYIRRVEQDPTTYAWCGVIVDEPAYKWKKKSFTPKKDLKIYECHIGMAQEKEGIGTYREFAENVLPRIRDLGYNTLQIMAIMEHPYYGSFGYQVSSFFAACSRYGTPNELKELIDTAHSMGIAVLLDLVHSHAVRNTEEGINYFDGTVYQFFHEGPRGEHPAWGTKLFNYNKNEVIHFLLSNLKFWMTEFRFDGFRFDGVTSMIYHDHGLGTAFTDYGKYFSLNTDTEAITYLQLANALIREVNPKAITIAEDMSAMPGMCLPIEEGGIGFDYRLAMGIPDLWIKLLKKCPDEQWDMWHLWCELTGRRPGEKYIGYVESHDQALVGDKTVMFRLCDSNMYTSMSKLIEDPVIDRGIALHKMIRLVTLALGGEGYL